MDKEHWVKTSLVLALVSMMVVQVVESCSCMQAHPQTHFCNADFVIKAKTKGHQTVYSKTLLENGKTRREPFENKFKITVNKVLKETEAFQNISRKFVYSPYFGSTCGIHLQPNTKYLLTGHVRNNKPYVNLCTFVREWSQLPVRMRKGFNFQYEKNCACRVEVDYSSPDKPKLGDGDHCTLHPRRDPGDCYSQHALCKHSPSQESGNSTGECRWTRPRVWKDCMKRAEEEARIEP